MRKWWYQSVKKMLLLWSIWSVLLTGYELVRIRIPVSMHLYEEEAREVLSGSQPNLSPNQLYLDFAGDVEITETSNGSYQAVCNLFGLIPLKTVEVSVVETETLIPGGIPVGIYVQTDGVFVIGTGPIETENGTVESPAKNILKTGDYIISFQGEKICRKQELIEKLQQFYEEELVLGIRRNHEELEVRIHPIVQPSGASIGVWVRDDTQGVGTLTYITDEKKFGALGHGIADSDSEVLMEVSKGRLYGCEIIGIIKGKAGSPGKLAGKIAYHNQNLYGQISGNLSGGIYGSANEHLMQSVTNSPLPIALKQEVQEGKAVILSSVSGELKEYEVEIRKIHRSDENVNKGMELTVTDDELLELTGGIVQGMSGSPIIQDGKLVGAVTHVLVNDPTRGYGIFIENMLDAAG